MKRENDIELNIFKRIAKIFFRVLYNVITILCLILIFIIVLQKITDNNGSIAGYRIFRVVSGSMIPRYNIGEVVICKQIPGDEIELGDTIVYRGRDGDLDGKLIMHEVIAKIYDENDNLKITAKGLLNGQEDPDISDDEVLGVVKVSSSILTLLYTLATSTYSSFIIIFILAVNVFINFKPTRSRINKEKSEEGIEVFGEDEDVINNLEEDSNEVENYENDLDAKEE